MNRHLRRFVTCVTAVGVLSTTATGMAAASSTTPPPPVAVDSKTMEIVDQLEALRGRIDAATAAGDSMALRAAVDELRPVLDASYDVARSDMAIHLADEADAKATEIQRILPLGFPSPLDLVFGLVASVLALVGGLIATLVGLLPIPIPVPIPIPGAPAPPGGEPAPPGGLPLPGLPEVPGVPGVPEVPGVPGAPAVPGVPGLPLP